MKKLMMAAAIVCAAAFTQAASVEWGGAADAQGGTAFLATQKALLLYSASQISLPTSISGLAVGDTTNDGNASVIATTLLGDDYLGGEEFYATTGRDWTKLDGYYAILIANEDGTMTTFTDMGQIAGSTEKTTTVNLKYNESWGEGYDKYLGENGYQVAVVPEPTSGLLLLLGVAGMALRRRRA